MTVKRRLSHVYWNGYLDKRDCVNTIDENGRIVRKDRFEKLDEFLRNFSEGNTKEVE